MSSSTARLSLGDMSRLAPSVLQRGSSAELALVSHPTLADLTESLQFSPGDGRIWLHDQRMVLMHASSLGQMRRELVENLGVEGARGLLTRIGYASGVRDANLVRQYWPDSEPAHAFAAGPRLHAIEGVVQVEPVRFEFDAAKGQFYGEFIWRHSVEDDLQVAGPDHTNEPACWMQIGYASGYASAFLGRLIMYREVQCRSTGADVCRIIGKPVDEWDDPQADIRYLSAQDFTNSMRQSTAVDASERPLIGVSPPFNAATHMIRRVAPTQATVLFTGESGVGKEMFAWHLHRISPRAAKPFVAINCAAIPENLIESELFGVERGAFTGAVSARPGRFERAEGGTLFLDEVGTLSAAAQGKLLRVLQEREVERLGGTRSMKVDVRVVAATNVNLREAVTRGEFRIDLYYRLNVFPVHLPPLRERREDIPLLTDYFLHKYCQRHQRSVRGISHAAATALLSYAFPGNVRELENMVERAVILAPEGGVVEVFHLFFEPVPVLTPGLAITDNGMLRSGHSSGTPDGSPSSPSSAGSRQPLLDWMMQACEGGLSLNQLEDDLYAASVLRSQGNLADAARRLGLTRAQLAYRLREQRSKG